jgi:hypothetical protein
LLDRADESISNANNVVRDDVVDTDLTNEDVPADEPWLSGDDLAAAP